MSAVREQFYQDRECLVTALSDELAAVLEKAIADRGEACLLVSGGSTPKPVYRALASRPLDWSKVTVALVDERWVDADHPASNEQFIRENLLIEGAAAAKFVAMKTSAATAVLGLPECLARYGALPLQPDLCVLGMGLDGHTASLFPHASGLDSGLAAGADRCVAITAQQSEVTGPHTERMTLSVAAILACRHIVLLITGDEKLAVYRQALSGPDAREMPVRAVLRQSQTPVSVYWSP
ncbi:6-phosphogluconolactonase [Spongiibacter nanhainus]|uniref:6-phosphogluconolactonase n=1 Tax=Spongiibacter nanhainus TaxID=2794344 RepID=A0A7T4UNW7_9GAMM|nr:6-phosphogluconolactonase [Spongiibacter nanhainus]QQD17001.1 6-phosphogluconolactonase [Spongiibacter nanhainus]